MFQFHEGVWEGNQSLDAQEMGSIQECSRSIKCVQGGTACWERRTAVCKSPFQTNDQEQDPGWGILKVT